MDRRDELNVNRSSEEKEERKKKNIKMKARDRRGCIASDGWVDGWMDGWMHGPTAPGR